MDGPKLFVWIGSNTDKLDVLRYVNATDKDILNQPVVRAALNAKACTEGHVTTGSGHPDFASIVNAIEQEAQTIAAIHVADPTGQAASDVGALRRLSLKIEKVGRRLGYIP